MLRVFIFITVDILKTVPPEVFLDVSTISSRHIGVFATSDIEEKTIIGPLPGVNLKYVGKEDAENAWELLDDKGCISGYLQTLDDQVGSWMGLIQCARYPEEQNLEMFQENACIHYRVVKHIRDGEELLVWYNIQVPQCLGIPDFEPERYKNNSLNNDEENLEISSAPNYDDDRKKVACVLCHKGFNSRSNLRSHMRTHTNQRPFQCSTCGKRFSQSSTLRNHIRLHTGEKPYKCITCQSSYSQLAGLRAHQKSSQHRPNNSGITLNC